MFALKIFRASRCKSNPETKPSKSLSCVKITSGRGKVSMRTGYIGATKKSNEYRSFVFRVIHWAFLHPPPPRRDETPDCFHHSERPRSLQKPIDRSQRTGAGESQNKPAAAILQRVTNQHG